MSPGPTPRYDLYRPEGSEEVDVDLHLNSNWDKIDAAVRPTELAALQQELDNSQAQFQADINALKISVFGSTDRDEAPSCKIAKTGTSNVSKETVENVTFGVVSWETDANMSPANFDWINIKVAGIYIVTFQWAFDAAFNASHRGYICLNDAKRGGAKFAGAGASPGAGGATGIVTGVYSLAVDTKVSAQIWHNSTTQETLTNVGEGTYLALTRTGARP